MTATLVVSGVTQRKVRFVHADLCVKITPVFGAPTINNKYHTHTKKNTAAAENSSRAVAKITSKHTLSERQLLNLTRVAPRQRAAQRLRGSLPPSGREPHTKAGALQGW